MAGPGICVLCLADTCSSEVHLVFNPVSPYGYLLVFVYSRYRKSRLVCVMLLDLDFPDITRFYEVQRQPSSGSAWPTCQKNGKSDTQYWGREVLTQFVQQFVPAVITPSFGARCSCST